MTERDYNYLTELRQIVSEMSKIRGALEKIAREIRLIRKELQGEQKEEVNIPDLETFCEMLEDDGK